MKGPAYKAAGTTYKKHQDSEFHHAKERAVAFRKGRMAPETKQGRKGKTDDNEDHHERRNQLMGDSLTLIPGVTKIHGDTR